MHTPLMMFGRPRPTRVEINNRWLNAWIVEPATDTVGQAGRSFSVVCRITIGESENRRFFSWRASSEDDNGKNFAGGVATASRGSFVGMVEIGNNDLRGRSKLEQRVIDAADQVLRRDAAVGPIELLTQLRFLEHVHVEEWKRGNPAITVLEDHIQCGEKKLADTFRYFQQWAEAEGLEPAEAVYQGPSRSGARELQIIADDDPRLEKFYRTRYLR